jgi:hypothetical protein
MKASDLKQLAQEHLDDANTLQGGQRFAGAIYLAGYAVECALKFRICQTLGWSEFPPSNEHRALRSHDLNFLLNYSGKLLEIKKEHLVPWQRIEDWNPEMRYATGVITTAQECSEYITTVKIFVNILIT